MKKIRILMVLGNTRRGGAQAFIMNLLREIDKSLFQIDFAINNDFEGGYGPEIKSLGSELFIMPKFNVKNWLSFEKAWYGFFKKHQYNIVHGHTTNSAGIYLKVAKKYGCKTIAHIHSTGFRGSIVERIAKQFFCKLTKSQADYWFACSGQAAYLLYGNDFKIYSKYYEIPNSIKVENYLFNNDRREAIRKELGIQLDTLLCGHVGTFSEPKNHSFLLKVFQEINRSNANSKLLIIGEGYLKEQIFQLAKELEIVDKIINLRNIPNVYDYMMAMDVFIFPSVFEGFGMVALESQAAGLKTVMSDVVPKATHLTNIATPLSLGAPIATWAEECMNYKVECRQEYNTIIKQTKYDLEKNVQFISGLYKQMVN